MGQRSSVVEQLICNQLVGGSTPSAGSNFMNGFLYILQSETSGRYYVGSAKDPDRRLSQHNSNAVVATRNKGPWARVALVHFSSSAIALEAEAFIKRQKSRRILELIISGKFVWPDQYPR